MRKPTFARADLDTEYELRFTALDKSPRLLNSPGKSVDGRCVCCAAAPLRPFFRWPTMVTGVECARAITAGGMRCTSGAQRREILGRITVLDGELFRGWSRVSPPGPPRRLMRLATSVAAFGTPQAQHAQAP